MRLACSDEEEVPEWMEPLRYVPSHSLRPRCSVCTVLLVPCSCFVVVAAVADDNDGVEAAADNWPVR